MAIIVRMTILRRAALEAEKKIACLLLTYIGGVAKYSAAIISPNNTHMCIKTQVYSKIDT
jgi:hypothetical protein